MTGDEFDIRSVARAALAESLDPDPLTVADVVFRRIPVAEYPRVIWTLLPHLLRDLGREPIIRESGGHTNTDTHPDGASVLPAPDGVATPQPTPSRKSPAVGVSKWERFRGWSTTLRVSLDLEGKVDVWLPAMTWNEVCKRRDLLYQKSSETSAQADRWRTLAELMVAQGSEVVGDLSENKVRQVLGL
jgi:hypothetical protein